MAEFAMNGPIPGALESRLSQSPCSTRRQNSSSRLEAMFDRISGDQRGVDRADRGADHPVGLDARFVQRLVDADLVGAERAAALEDQDDLTQRGLERTARPAWVRRFDRFVVEIAGLCHENHPLKRRRHWSQCAPRAGGYAGRRRAARAIRRQPHISCSSCLCIICSGKRSAETVRPAPWFRYATSARSCEFRPSCRRARERSERSSCWRIR